MEGPWPAKRRGRRPPGCRSLGTQWWPTSRQLGALTQSNIHGNIPGGKYWDFWPHSVQQQNHEMIWTGMNFFQNNLRKPFVRFYAWVTLCMCPTDFIPRRTDILEPGNKARGRGEGNRDAIKGSILPITPNSQYLHKIIERVRLDTKIRRGSLTGEIIGGPPKVDGQE